MTKHLFLSCCLIAPCLSASVVTTGSITIGSMSGTFDFVGSGFQVTGSFDTFVSVWRLKCTPCAPGSIQSASGFPSELSGGTAQIGSTFYPNVNWDSDVSVTPFVSNLFVTGGNITLDQGPGTYMTDFSFTGQLCGVLAPMYKACAVALPDLTGSGTVTATYSKYPVSSFPGYLVFESATYTFASVPEPGNICLVTAALAAFVMIARRQRHMWHGQTPVRASSAQVLRGHTGLSGAKLRR